MATSSLPAVLASPFRPFGLLGAAYGVVLMGAWVAAQFGLADGVANRPAWHGHEMLFGFAGAIVCAIALTALAGWAGTPEVHGATLALLVALWAVARATFWLAPWLPAWGAVLSACVLWFLLAGLTAAQIAAQPDRRWWLLPVLFAAIGIAAALAGGGRAGVGLELVVHALMILFALTAGVFVPVFTRTQLRGRGMAVPLARPSLDVAAVASLVVLAVVDLAGAPPAVRGVAALAAFALHAVRLGRWRGWHVLDAPLVWTLHAGYAWLVVALLLSALGGFGVAGAQRAWLHAFTVGALGSMMIGLLTRVVLRHTGRPLVVAGSVRVVFVLVQVAALLRVIGAGIAGGAPWVVTAGLAWTLAFALYLHAYARFLVAPSLPRAASPLALDSRPRPDVR